MLCNGFFHKCGRRDPSCKQYKMQKPTFSLCHDLKWGPRGSEIHSNNHLRRKGKKNIWNSLRRKKNDQKINKEHWLFPFSFFFLLTIIWENVMGMWPREHLQGKCHTTTEWTSRHLRACHAIWVDVTPFEWMSRHLSEYHAISVELQ